MNIFTLVKVENYEKLMGNTVNFIFLEHHFYN